MEIKTFWLAEHHIWAGMASLVTPILVGRAASVMEKIRIEWRNAAYYYFHLFAAERFYEILAQAAVN
ncbi:hypothetical protein [Fictibacillus arsenicus]|uniref:Uncharacterized protein n=1 Tax=Fictibacillus arsenicus TaxID=255247 RepID=A0A1V3GBE7_9BACL|nr:hypothetical protein [Fictibacillus arsenicus]OOE14173.1 hypothetical protein UN64_02900 [Fictibacillus arsenicus]